MNTPVLSENDTSTIKSILLGDLEPEDDVNLYSKLIKLHNSENLIETIYTEYIHLILI